MGYFYYLDEGFRGTLQSWRARKGRWLILAAVQTLLFFSLLAVLLTYQLKIVQEGQHMLESMSSAFGSQPEQDTLKGAAAIQNSFHALLQQVLTGILWLFLLFLLGNGALWLLTHNLLRKGEQSWKVVAQQWLKYAAVTATGGVLLLIVFYVTLKNLFALDTSMDSITRPLIIASIGVLILYYFSAVAFALVTESSWKHFFKDIFHLGIQKIHRALPALIISMAAILLSFLFIYNVLNRGWQVLWLMLASLIFIIVVVFARIWWTACLQSLQHEKDHR